MIITPERFKAVLFDLDGVLTSTMSIHASCWKKMFDAYLEQRAERFAERQRPFEIDQDYKPYVDGRLRQDGVRSFLASRGIKLPEGTPDDPPTRETVWGLGNRKDRMVHAVLEADGVEIFPGALRVVRRVRADGLMTAVVSASRNCRLILQVAGIVDLFDEVVDGAVAARLGLHGKPAPDTFLHAAQQLAVEPQAAVVVEDAVAGVAAGRAGGFGLVIGIDHHGDRSALQGSGADIVVEDLEDILNLDEEMKTS
jgi:beta-phosphoglucomutase family hydrolase